MGNSSKYILPATIAMTGLLSIATTSFADSLVTSEGAILIGEIHKTDAGYSVNTKDGIVQVNASDVRSVLLDRHPAAVTPHPPAPTANKPRPVNPNDPKTLALLLQQGNSALAAEEFEDARNAFSDALIVDPKNAIAGRGLGYAYLKLKKPEKAAEPLKIAATGLPTSRGLTMSLAAALVAAHDPMAAVKLLATFFQTHPSMDAIDEPMLNALGIALWQADPSMMHTSTFTDGVKLYAQLNTQLEATQPGKKRWGTEWLDASVVADRQKARRAQQAKVDQAWTSLQDVTAQMTNAQAALATATKLPKTNPDRQKAISDAEAAIVALKPKLDAAQSQYDDQDAELTKLPGPVFPSVIELADTDYPTLPASTDRQVIRYAAAFAVAPDVFVTAAEPVEGAGDIHVVTSDGKTYKATVLRTHHGDGLALLEVSGAKLPCLRLATQNKPGPLSCIGYPDVDLVSPIARPTEVTAAQPNTDWTVQSSVSPRIPGAPLLKNGLISGVELGTRDSDPAAIPAATLKELESLVANQAPPTQFASDARKAVVLVITQH